MSKIEDLIKQYCPNGCEWKPLYEVTVWDKRFNSVERYKQPAVIDYKKYFLGEEQKRLVSENGSVKILTTYVSNLYADENSVVDYITDGEIVCIPWGGNAIVQYYKGKFVTGDNRIATSLDVNVLSNKYLYYMMQCNLHLIASFYRGSGIKHPDMSKVLDILIPVPSRPVQDEIVRILDRFTELEKELEKELELRRKQYEFYRDELLTFGDDVERIATKDLVESKFWLMPATPSYVDSGVRYITSKNIKNGKIDFSTASFISKEDYEELSKNRYVKTGDLLITMIGTIGECAFVEDETEFYGQNLYLVRLDDSKINCRYYKYYFEKSKSSLIAKKNDSSQGYLKAGSIDGLIIPVPSPTEQQRIVKILDKFDTLTTSLTSGLPAEIKLRKQQYEYYRDYLFGLLN